MRKHGHPVRYQEVIPTYRSVTSEGKTCVEIPVQDNRDWPDVGMPDVTAEAKKRVIVLVQKYQPLTIDDEQVKVSYGTKSSTVLIPQKDWKRVMGMTAPGYEWRDPVRAAEEWETKQRFKEISELLERR